MVMALSEAITMTEKRNCYVANIKICKFKYKWKRDSDILLHHLNYDTPGVWNSSNRGHILKRYHKSDLPYTISSK